jgi:parallel beta-helix repeat protein
VPGAGVYVNLGGDPSTQDVHIGRRRYGFYLPNREYIRIEGFTLLEPDDRGIQLNNGSNHVEIVNNVVRWSGNIGIQAIGTRDSRIAGNIVSGCGDHGISLISGSTRCTIEGNESSFNADPAKRRANGLYLFGCPANTIRGNHWHHNQDSGQQVQSGSDSVLSIQNVSWANGDHGFDHLHARFGTTVGDVAYGNYKDGFSFEGNAVGHTIYNSIAVENGLTTNEADLWVDDSSTVEFHSNANVFWNSTSQPPIKRGLNRYASVSGWADSSGQDVLSLQADPLFADPEAGDFHLKESSPAIDNAESDVPFWPATDASGAARVDDPQTPNTGVGPTAFADRGAYEYQVQGTTTAGAPGHPAREPALLIRPNPMRAEAEIRFDTRRDGPLSVALYDLGGRCVRMLRAGGSAAAGTQRFTLNARAGDGRPLQAGVYFVRVQGPDGVRSSRLLVIH